MMGSGKMEYMPRLPVVIWIPLAVAVFAACRPTPTPDIPDIQATVAAAVQTALPAKISENRAAAPDVEATIAAGVEATVQAMQSPAATGARIISPTPTPARTPPATPTLTPTPGPEATSTPLPADTATPMPTATPTLSQLMVEIEPSVVQIITSVGRGSGFIVDVEGWIITNAHVVSGFTEVTVVGQGLAETMGTVVGLDEKLDLAVVRVEADGLTSLTLADSGGVSVGDDVAAIGFALGTILGSSASVTKGVVSAKREIDGLNYLQTDAAINPGNSGGPLIDALGRVVGINTSRVEEVLGRLVQGVGLAIASDHIRSALPLLMSGELAPDPSASFGRADRRPAGGGQVYLNEKHWYSVQVPTGWLLNDDDPDQVFITSDEHGGVVWISVDRVDADRVYSLDRYLGSGLRPAPDAGWTNWDILSERRINPAPGLPQSEAQEFVYTFTDRNGGEGKGRVLWQLVGGQLITLDAVSNADIWDFYSDELAEMLGIQNSFNPWSFRDDELGYALAFPSGWATVTSSSADYMAADRDTSAVLWTEVSPDQGHAGAGSYGAEAGPTDAGFSVIKRRLVFTKRESPAYRIDYFGPSPEGVPLRGALLISLGGGNAVRTVVQAEAEDWQEISPDIDDIFLRVSVRP